MNRKPPIEVRRELRREVGYGCPVSGCGNPYLQWHHFDPPWREEEHHNPAGMIALCGEHHDQADAGAFTKEQLQAIKRNGAEQWASLTGRFNWMRNHLLAVVGGNFYYETPVIFKFRGEPAIWFNRDEAGNFLLNVRMLSISGQPRLRIEDNYWLTKGQLADLECPPSGRLIHAKYDNGDELRVEFFTLDSVGQLQKRYPDANPAGWGLHFPITAVEVLENVGQTEIAFGPRWTKLPGVIMRNNFARNCGAGVALG